MQKLIDIFCYALISALVATPCERIPKTRQAGIVDSELRPYLDNFILEARKYGIGVDSFTLNVRFVDTLPVPPIPNTVALATCDGFTVRVKKSYWIGASPLDREQIIFHEFGHCLLGLKHNDSKQLAYDFLGSPNAFYISHSLMNSVHMPVSFYAGNREAYLRQLFNPMSATVLYYGTPFQYGNAEYFKKDLKF